MRESIGLTGAKKSLQLFQPRETSTEMNGKEVKFKKKCCSRTVSPV